MHGYSRANVGVVESASTAEFVWEGITLEMVNDWNSRPSERAISASLFAVA